MDEDGWANLAKYASGLRRIDEPEAVAPAIALSTDGDNSYVVYTYRRLIGTSRRVDYVVEDAKNLTGEWLTIDPSDGLLWEVSEPVGNGLTEEVRLHIPVSSAGSTRILRLRFILVD